MSEQDPPRQEGGWCKHSEDTVEMREGLYHSYTALGAPSPLENPRGSKIWAAGLESTLTCLEDPAVVFVESTGSRQAEQLSSYVTSALPEPVHLWGREGQLVHGVVQGLGSSLTWILGC